LWNKECFTKVVGEVGSLISIDESTVMWENLEFARLQVRVLRSSSARMAKSMKINGQVMAILLEEEQPTRLVGQCMCHRNYFDSSESISSSETYVEESDVSGFISVGEDVHAREVRQSEEKLADGEDWSRNRTKVPLSKVTATRGIRMQNKDSILITKEEVKGNEEVEVAALCYQYEHLCGAARNYPNGHAQMARLVVDLECKDLQSQPTLPLGQQQEKEAQLCKGGATGQSHSRNYFEHPVERVNEVEEEARDTQLGALDSQTEVEKESKAGKWQNHIQEVRLPMEKGSRSGSMPHELPEEGETEVGSPSKNLSRRGKMKASTELGNQKTYTRRSVRLSERTPNSKRDVENKEGMFATSDSDGDTNQRKDRECKNVIREEPENLWSIGEHIGLACRGVEDEVIQEYNSMEDRDLEVRKFTEVGNPTDFYVDL